MAGTQPSKNAEKSALVNVLRTQFPLEMLLSLVGLKRSMFFYHLAEKSDKNEEIEQKIAEIYHEHRGNYGYRRITLVLRKIWTINHKKAQAIMQKLGLKGNANAGNTVHIKERSVKLRLIS